MAQRLAHTVKGVAGNLGVDDLQAVSGQLESAIKQGELDEAKQLLKPFSESLALVMEVLKVFSEDTGEAEPGGPAEQNACEADPEKLLVLMEELFPLVQKRKAKPCKKIMAEISGLGCPEDCASEVSQLGKWIGKYKFKEALPVLKGLIDMLKSGA